MEMPAALISGRQIPIEVFEGFRIQISQVYLDILLYQTDLTISACARSTCLPLSTREDIGILRVIEENDTINSRDAHRCMASPWIILKT